MGKTEARYAKIESKSTRAGTNNKGYSAQRGSN